MNEHDIRFLQRALELARQAVGLASPNPHVGCVIVRNGEIVGEGFHQYDLKDHAEIVALKQAGEKSRGSTLYATLEPCNHTGRTPPCTDAIIAAGIARVVAGLRDPNPRVSGGGAEKLQAAGIPTEFAYAQEYEAAKELNEGFFRWSRTALPFVTLKSAMTLDAQLALSPAAKGKRHAWITSEEARAEVHRMRHASDALLTGIGTVLADNPKLTDRSGLPRRRKLLRVVLDAKLRIPLKSHLVQSADGDLVIVTAASEKSAKARQLQKAGAEILRLPAAKGRLNLKSLLRELGKRQILSVLLESGPTLNASALAADVVDKLVLFYAPKVAGHATVPFVHGPVAIPRFRSWKVREQDFGGDFCVEAWLRD